MSDSSTENDSSSASDSSSGTDDFIKDLRHDVVLFTRCVDKHEKEVREKCQKTNQDFDLIMDTLFKHSSLTPSTSKGEKDFIATMEEMQEKFEKVRKHNEELRLDEEISNLFQTEECKISGSITGKKECDDSKGYKGKKKRPSESEDKDDGGAKQKRIQE